MKRCFKCGKLKDINKFYRHPKMTDGHLGKCIACTKKDTKKRYYDPISRKEIIEYEKQRASDPKRRELRAEYQRVRRQRHPIKYHAWMKVNNLIRDGKLVRQPCEICGNPKAEAHHEDYRKKLEIKWWCRKHHKIMEGKLPF